MQTSAVKCTLLRKLRIDIGLQHRMNIDKVMLLDILFHVVDIFRLHIWNALQIMRYYLHMYERTKKEGTKKLFS